ncbi:hypothetical protein RJ40_11215 [Methanofollis aquaemaris]|uniref:Uncharacterized protein n=1 Tax=Methanofollis aquaemaris TaxID=126734 RepID=A0A8A3S7W4_9EURY|nr:hypothetical protein [Methanofollis aquaemaris]QSZ68023.1 hypothetical protein RJ40_11215 [Methanofollis aquaemaris]
MEKGDQAEIEGLLTDISQIPRRKEKKELLDTTYSTVLEIAFREKRPELTRMPLELPRKKIFKYVKDAAEIYTETKDRTWLQAVFDLSNSLDRKSSQSVILSEVTKNLIEAGVDKADSDLIEAGMEVFHQISFRKYRSAILMDIVPLHIVWSITTRDTTLLTESLGLIEGIGDISKRSLLQSEVTKAIGRIGVIKRDFDLIITALRSAAEIRQKIRRTNCFASIISQAWKSPLSTQISDIMSVLRTLSDLQNEEVAEITASLTDEMIARGHDKGAVISTLEEVEKTYPFTLQAIIGELLGAAERLGDPYYFEAGLRLNSMLGPDEEVQIKEIVKAGIAVVERTGEARFIIEIVPIVEEAVSGHRAFTIYLTLVHTLLERGAFSHAIDIYAKIPSFSEIVQIGMQFWDTSVMLVSNGVLRDRVDQVQTRVFERMDTSTKESLIQRSITHICKDTDLNEIIHHISSLVALANLHRHRDEQLLGAIDQLIERRFIDHLDPSYLIEIARQIRSPTIASMAVARIVADMADFGFVHRNRDVLQRAVGLTCEIRGQKARSEALCSVIDRAADLAVAQGDLTLLKRMRGWTDPLLEREYGLYTTGNIVRGMVKYGIDTMAPHALENAYDIAREIEDPSLRQQLLEGITEGFIRVGCRMMAEPLIAGDQALLENRMAVFRRSTEILRETVSERRYSIRLARGIDIITEYLKKNRSPYFAIPMAMLLLEIRSEAEQDAMVTRVSAEFEEYVDDLPSTDPYEMMAFLLQRLEYAKESPEVMELTRALFVHIANLYTRYSGMCTLSESYLRIHDHERAGALLRSVHEGTRAMDLPYEKALILSDLAGLMAKVETDEAYTCFNEAKSLLPLIDFEMGGVVRKHLVFSLVSLHAIKPQEKNVDEVIALINEIIDPADFVNSLVAAFGMLTEGGQTHEVMKQIYGGIEEIPLAYDRASMLLSVVPLAEKYGEEGDALALLQEADHLTTEIEIPVVAAMVKKGVSHMYLMLAAAEGDEDLRREGLAVIKGIENEVIRHRIFEQLGVSPEEQITDPAYNRLIDASQEVIVAHATHPDTSSIEYLIENISDRAQRARYCFELFVIFRDAEMGRTAENLLLVGLDEASIIRPLSRRVYVLSDLALSLHEAGERKKSRDIIGMAVNAATNIRQDDLRDEVFNELDVVIRILQEGREV